MSTYTQDDFTDADGVELDVHMPNVGVWHSRWNADGFIDGNQLHNSNFGAETVLAGDPPDTADYAVSVDIVTDGGGAGVAAGVLARYTFAGGGTGYQGAWWPDEGNWAIIRNDAGTRTAIATSATPALIMPGTQRIRLELEGAELRLYVDDALTCSATDSTYTATERAGLLVASLLQGWLALDDFLVTDLVPTAPGVHVVSGRGTLTLLGREWLSTEVDGRPAYITSGAAEPPNFYHVGMLSWGTGNGAISAYPVTRDLDLVRLPSGMTTLWYEFAPGITATIRELVGP